MTETPLPESWMTCSLSFLIDGIEAGLNFKCIEEPPTGQATGLVKISSVSWGRFLEQESKTIPAGMEPPEKIRIKVGDLLISRANTIELVGACVIVDTVTKRLYLSDKVLRLCASNEVKRWLLYYLRSPSGRRQIEARSSGNQLSMRNISQEALRSVEVPLPPLNEQKCIADKLDAVLARVDACRDRLDRVPDILKRFRQSVLTAATSGKLTEEWRGIDGDPMANPATRLSAALTEVVTGPFGSSLHKSDYVFGGVPIVNPMHINEGIVTPTPEMAVSPEKAQQLSDFALRAGDVLIARRGVMGRCAVVKPEQAGWLCGTGSMVLRSGSSLLPEYLQLFLSAPATVSALEADAVGSTMVNLNQRILMSLDIGLPSLNEQHEIVRRVESLFTFGDRLEARYTAARAQTERLTPALLAKAFRGELVSQDPNDEPASVLLERIRAAREAAPAKSRQRKGSSQPSKTQKAEITMLNRKDIQDALSR